jgi:hypothetical protein
VTNVKPLDEQDRRLAEAAAAVIEEAERAGLPDLPKNLGVTDRAFRLLARSYVELREQVRALHELVDQTDPNDPIGVALTKVGLASKPSLPGRRRRPLQVVFTPEQIAKLDIKELLAIYCRRMGDAPDRFTETGRYVVRVWDGMDGCWTDCLGPVGHEEALRYWAERTDAGTHHASYSEIDYYRIFPAGTRMQFDGSEGREMHR